jgi:hypothetical protein
MTVGEETLHDAGSIHTDEIGNVFSVPRHGLIEGEKNVT